MSDTIFSSSMMLGGIAAFTAFLIATASQSNSQTPFHNTVRLILKGYVIPIADREFVPGVADDGARLVASTMGLVKGDGVIVFVDPGFVSDRSSISIELEKADVDAQDITHVFISHHHPDHTLNAALFPNATLVDYWATYQGDLWEDHGDTYDIASGIQVVRTPGHTNEDASLVVNTATGIVVFTHAWWNEELFPPIDPLADDQSALETSRQLILSLADCIVPGHGSYFPNPEKERASCEMLDTTNMKQ